MLVGLVGMRLVVHIRLDKEEAELVLVDRCLVFFVLLLSVRIYDVLFFHSAI